jgi:hypothetical protein
MTDDPALGICADLGARTIREEIDAMEVLGGPPHLELRDRTRLRAPRRRATSSHNRDGQRLSRGVKQ